jgi:hypothetical protein
MGIVISKRNHVPFINIYQFSLQSTFYLSFAQYTRTEIDPYSHF